MKIAFKNFISTLRRYKASSLLNVIGLTLAFTAFYIILVMVWWETGYNRDIRDYDRIYLIQTQDWFEEGRFESWVNRPIPERVIASSPEVEAGGCLWGGFGDSNLWIQRQNGNNDKFAIRSGKISTPIIEIFSFQSVAGDLQDFKRPNTVLISRSASERMDIGVGDVVWIGDDTSKPENSGEIAAIFEDFPENSILGNVDIVGNIGEQSMNDTTQWSFNYFVKLSPGADTQTFVDRWEKIYKELSQQQAEEDGEDDEDSHIRLVRLDGLYYMDDGDAPCATGSRTTTYTMLGIAILVVTIAFINFINFFFALVPIRIRTVNTFKVFGAPASSLRFSFVFEAVGLVAISIVFALYVILALKYTELASYIPTSLDILRNLPVIWIMFGVATAMALAASLYPAHYITSFAPAMVVKGSFSGTAAGRRLRTLLIGFQFVISIALIISTMFIRRQHEYMMSYDMGFDRTDMYVAHIPIKAAESYETLRSKLMSNPQIKDVTGTSAALISEGGMGWGREFKGQQIHFRSHVVQWNFLDVMGINITEGRSFNSDDPKKDRGTLILNEMGRRDFNMTTEDHIDGFIGNEPIVGFCADFNFKPLEYGIEPFAFYVLPQGGGMSKWHLPLYVYIKVVEGADIDAISRYVRETVKEVDPQMQPGEIEFMSFDQQIGGLYAKEGKLNIVIGLFTLLSVAIALMGVFGIVMFETQHRRREIAVRKVMGATTGEILSMFNIKYIRIVLVCFAIATPLSIWVVGHWLSGYVYHIRMLWWVFAIALAAVLAVTVVTVTLRSWKTASENPADSVKSE